MSAAPEADALTTRPPERCCGNNSETGRFDNMDPANFISDVKFCTALLTLLMMAAESMMSKRPL